MYRTDDGGQPEWSEDTMEWVQDGWRPDEAPPADDRDEWPEPQDVTDE